MRTFGLVALFVICVCTFAFAEPPPTDISKLQMAGTVEMGGYGISIPVTLHSCVSKGALISCDYVMTSGRGEAFDYKYGGGMWATRMTDDHLRPHALVKGFFLNFDGDQEDTITLTKGQWVWVVQEFQGARPDIKSVNVIFPGGRYISTDIK